MRIGAATPIFRSFDEAKARAFYIDWLEFDVLFEHRFGPELPLYLALKRGAFELHLTEHHGDTTPGTRIRVCVHEIEAFAADLQDRPYGGANPGAPERQPWGDLELTLTDPFGNRITFFEPAELASR